ncbi:MAG: ABC transporter permease subunit [Actinomycetota bacterium]|nr:ABC transporter permease subunit [Actinomycetota bacterium]
MTDLLRAELLSTRKRPGTWIIGGAWVFLAVTFGMLVPYLVYLSLHGRPTSSAGDTEKLLTGVLPAQFVASSVGLYPLFGSALMLIFGAVLMGGDYRWGTLGTLLGQRPGRVAMMLGKAAAIGIALLFVTVGVEIAAGGMSALIAALAHRPAHWPGLGTLVEGVGAAWLVSAAAASLGSFLAVLFRNTGAAIGVGLIWLLALENLVSGIAGTLPALKVVQRLLIGPSGGSLATSLGSATQSNGGVPGVVAVSGSSTAIIVLSCYVAVFVGLATLLVVRRDHS